MLEVVSRIDRVVVHPGAAMVTRIASATLTASAEVAFVGLPAGLDEDSLERVVRHEAVVLDALQGQEHDMLDARELRGLERRPKISLDRGERGRADQEHAAYACKRARVGRAIEEVERTGRRPGWQPAWIGLDVPHRRAEVDFARAQASDDLAADVARRTEDEDHDSAASIGVRASCWLDVGTRAA